MRLHVSKVKLPDSETHYRYSDYHYEDGVRVKLLKFYSVYETQCYHYVVDEWDFNKISRWDLSAMADCKFNVINCKKVMKGALRSYCNKDKATALNSFAARKRSQIFHAETAMSKAKLSLFKIQDMNPSEIGDSINCGLDDHLRTFIFD